MTHSPSRSSVAQLAKRRSLLIDWLAASTLLFLLAAPTRAAADCAQWGLQGDMQWVQSKTGGAKVALFQLKQAGQQFSGIAKFRFPGMGGSLTPGKVYGTVKGSSFEATIYWDVVDMVGVYTGQITAQGMLEGRTYDKWNPSATASFRSERPLGCLQALAPPGVDALAAKLRGPPKALGRVQSNAPESPPKSICEMAVAARARNSPTAPALERRCSASAAPTEAPGTQAPGTPPPAEIDPAARAAASPLRSPALAPLATQRNKADAMALNPQPLPPASPLVLPAQVPSALR